VATATCAATPALTVWVTALGAVNYNNLAYLAWFLVTGNAQSLSTSTAAGCNPGYAMVTAPGCTACADSNCLICTTAATANC
jgi:hypothetical protein